MNEKISFGDTVYYYYSIDAKQAFMILQVRRGRREDGSYHVTMELNNIPKEALAIGMEEIFTRFADALNKSIKDSDK